MSITEEQRTAIRARGKVLVSASAGAGKTTVMITRLADIIEDGASLDDVLAVTFTKKAAAQMKTKLRAEIIARLNTSDEVKRDHLRTQLNKINSADISTIHSFCARLVRTYFYALGVDGSFDVLSEGAEESELKNRAMDDLFDGLYAGRDENLYALLKCLRKKRSDDELKKLLFEAYSTVRIRPDYKKILDQCCKSTYTDEGFEKVRAEYEKAVREKSGNLVGAIDRFAATFNPALNKAGYFKVLGQMRDSLALFAEKGDIFNPPSRLAATNKPGVKPEVAEDDARFSDFKENVNKRFKDLFKNIETVEAEREKYALSGELARAFIAVLNAFDEAYSGVKREEGKLDYGDLEHFALQLLCGEDSDADVREQINSRYKFVFVDEYQDVNPIQDEIITAVAGGDLFCVGDVKQAIYGFRGSRSSFFTAKSASAKDSGGFVNLPHNFRSSRGVIDFVNALFSHIMRAPVCNINYSDGHEMKGGTLYPEGAEGVAEICLFEGEEKGKKPAEGVYSVVGEEASGRITAEGKAVLQLVKEALNGTYYDTDDKKFKKIETKDICVLCRKRSNKNAQGIVRALTSAGYAVAGAAEVNICERPEILKILDILSYLENGEQDIPLVSALLSPLGGLTPVQLAKIRVAGGTGKDGPLFRECVKKYINNNDDGLAQRLTLFFERVENLRKLSKCLGAAALIDEIVRLGGFAALFDSQVKLAALRRLQREAQSASGELQLSEFLAKVRASENKILAPSSLSADCIKVMTMHASKGLEFPVVIVADVAAKYEGENHDDMLFDDSFGFAPRAYGQKTRAYKSTLLRKLVKMKSDGEELNNEINLFYVACTRAKYALHVLCSENEPYDEVTAAYASTYAQLFCASEFNRRTLDGKVEVGDNGNDGNALDESRADEAALEKLRSAAFGVYPYALGIELPVKSSASRLIADMDDENAVQLFDDEIIPDAGTSVESGLAYHRFLELCDFEKRTEKQIEEELAVFQYHGLITEGQRKLLKVDELVKILGMPIFSGLDGKALYREREFVCRLASDDYLALKGGKDKAFDVGSDDGNGVIVQGAIDLLAVTREGGRAVRADIIDYKYTARSDEHVKRHYAPQLELYRSVVAKIYNLPLEAVTKTIINIRALRQLDM